MFKNIHAITVAAAAGAALLLAGASPSLACYATATPCWEAPPPTEATAPVEHRGARLYNVVPGGSTTGLLRPSAHRPSQRGSALSGSK